MTDTWVDEAEELAKLAAEDLFADYNAILDTLAPDGRPWGFKKRTEKEQLQEYLDLGLHDNQQAWVEWMTQRVGEITTAVADIDPETVATIHPWDIVVRYALELGSTMEGKLEREQGRFLSEAEPVFGENGVEPRDDSSP